MHRQPRSRPTRRSYEKACPKGSQIAQGPVHSLLGPASSSALSAGTACNPYLKVFNGGQGTQVFFFTTAPDAASQYTCAGLTDGRDGAVRRAHQPTGQELGPQRAAAARHLEQGGRQPGLYGSLITETLFPVSETKKINGKTVGYMQSIACKGHKRPFSITFTAQDYGGGSETQTVSGNASC